MGNKTSQLSRSAPRSLAGGSPNASSTTTATSRVSFTKSDEIRRDGVDLHLNQMLKELGPVQIPRLSTTFKPRTDNMIKILEIRGNDSQDSASRSTTNASQGPTGEGATRLKLETIVNILKQTSPDEVAQETKKMLQLTDRNTLDYLVQHFNTIDTLKLVKNPDPNQQDQPIKMAVWSQSSPTSQSSQP